MKVGWWCAGTVSFIMTCLTSPHTHYHCTALSLCHSVLCLLLSPIVLAPHLLSSLLISDQPSSCDLTGGCHLWHISKRERERRCVVLVSGCCDVRYWVQGVRCKVYVRLYLALAVWCVMVPGVRHTTDWPLPAALPTWDRPARRLAITRDDQSALLWTLSIPGLSPLSSL